MGKEYTCITRKIEVHLHKHGDSEEANQRRKDEFKIWNDINDNLYKAANRIVSHSFFNDAYEYRLGIQNPRKYEIEKQLRRNNLSKETRTNLEKENKIIDKEISKKLKLFLSSGAKESGDIEFGINYRIISNEFLDIIPSDILTTLNHNIKSTYSKAREKIKNGERSIPNFKKGLPVPFPLSNKQIIKRNDGSIYIKFPKGLEWDLFFGRDRSNNREIVERILSGEYIVCNSNLQEAKNKKIFLLLVVKIPKQNISLDKNRIVGVDLGINTPLYAALNDNKYGGISIGSRDEFLRVRMRMAKQKKELQHFLRQSTNGGHGRKQKLQALERLEGKERKWVQLQNHIFSKELINFALQNNAGVIQMENLSGFGKNKFDEVDEKFKYILRYWSFFELQTMIEYKADKVGIEVKYVNPYHTSQTCSFCGHYEQGQRINQSTFICKNPDCKEGKGKQNSDGSYNGINADWNAARNIALSKDYIDKKKK